MMMMMKQGTEIILFVEPSAAASRPSPVIIRHSEDITAYQNSYEIL
jgi:hypothetical protein